MAPQLGESQTIPPLVGVTPMILGTKQQAGETLLSILSNLVGGSKKTLHAYGITSFSQYVWQQSIQRFPLSLRFKVYARWLGRQRGLCGRLPSLKLGGWWRRRWNVEQHRLPGKRFIVGTGEQWRVEPEPCWEEVQQQGELLVWQILGIWNGVRSHKVDGLTAVLLMSELGFFSICKAPHLPRWQFMVYVHWSIRHMDIATI